MTKVKSESGKKALDNRFELCLIASKRAKDILSGAPTEHDKSVKSPINALDEIAAGELDLDQVRKNIAAGDNIYQSEVAEGSENIEEGVADDKDKIFQSENLAVVD